MSKNTRNVTVFIQLICWGLIVSFLFLWKSSAQAKSLFQVTTPEPFLGAIYYDQAAIWKVFDHNLPVGGPGDDGNVDVVHYDGSIHYAVTATAVPGATATPATTPAPEPYVPGEYGYDQHLGIDYGLQYQPVLAAASGVVEAAGWYDAANHRVGYGLHIVMSHSENSNYTTWYGHLSSLTVQTGDKICIEDTGQTSNEICIDGIDDFIEPNDRRRILGISGNTGSVFNSLGNTCGNVENNSSCGQHLHFEVRYNGRVVNPYGWVATADPNGTPIFDPWSIHANGATSYNIWATPPAISSSQYQANGPVLPTPVLPTSYIIVDNSDEEEYSENPANCLQTETGGYNGDYRYMPVTDFTGTPPTPTCLARWAISPPNGTTPNDDLYYDVYVYIPNTTAHTLTRGAVYSVWHRPDATSPLKESQAIVVQAVFSPNADYGSPWVYIGRYFFTLDGTEYIEVGNVTLDGDVAGYVVAVDAIQLSANTLPPVNTATPSPSATSTPSPTSSPTPSGTPTIAATPPPTPDPNYLTRLTGAAGGRSPAMTNDGRYIAYASGSDLVRYDRINGVTEVVASGVTVSQTWPEMDISDDGRYIVFSAPEIAHIHDIYLFDYQTGQIENISSSVSGNIVINYRPHISLFNNNPIVIFTSNVDSTYILHLYEPGQTALEVINPTNLPANVARQGKDISVDSTEILFATNTTLFVYNRITGSLQTIQPPRTAAAIHSADLSHDANAQFVVYSMVQEICTPYCSATAYAYFMDRTTGQTEQIYSELAIIHADLWPRISNDGRYAYYSDRFSKLFVYDRVDDILRQLVYGYNGQGPGQGVDIYDISGDGQFITFSSLSTNLDPTDTNGISDVFLIDTTLWSPPVVPTATPIPTPTPTSTCVAQAVILVDGGLDVNEGYAAKPDNNFVGKVQQTAELLNLLYQLRDDVMSQTEQGQMYITLYETHTNELSGLVLADSALFQQAYDTLTMFTPHFQDLLEGDGTNVVITAAEVQAVQDYLDNVIAVGSPALQQTIAQERANLPLENFIGLTPNDAWTLFNNSGNLLQNGDFEDGLLHWQSGGSGNVSISNDAVTGNNALEIGSGTNSYQVIFDVAGGWTYTFSGWAKRTGGIQWAAAGLNFFDAAGNQVLIQNEPITASIYEPFSLSVVAPANAVRVHVRANIATGTGLLYLDSLALEASSNIPSTPTPTFTPTSTPTQSPGVNLLQNEDFEEGLLHWQSGVSGNVSISNDAVNGNNALLIGSDTNSYQVVFDVVGGWTYTFSGWAKRTGGTQWADVALNFFDAAGSQVLFQSEPIIASVYEPFSLSAAAPANAVRVHARVHIASGTGSLYVDSLSLVASSSAPNTATPTVTATSTPTNSPTFTPTFTPTSIPSVTPTVAPSATGTTTLIPTNTPTAENTIPPTATLTPTSTPTQLPGGSTFTFIPIDDSFVAAHQPNGNQGGSSLLRTDAMPENLSFVKFDVQNLDSDAVSSAKLRLFVLDANAVGFNVYRVDDNNWDEGTVTYNTAPTLGLFINTSGAISANGWVEVDVTEYITGEGVFSFALTATNDAIIRYRSKESNNAPELVIITESGATMGSEIAIVKESKKHSK